MRKYTKHIIIVAVSVFLVVFVLHSAQSVSYTNPSTVSFSFRYASATVGDSWSVGFKRPLNAQVCVGRGGATIDEVEVLVRNFNATAETVYIVHSGINDVFGNDISLDSLIEQLPSLADACREKLRPKTIIIYNPREMWKLLENRDYCLDPLDEPLSREGYLLYDIHLNDAGYEELKKSRPLTYTAQ